MGKQRLVLTLLLLASLTLQQDSLKQTVPQSFGLTTMTYMRANDNSQFEKYLLLYAFMDCPIITEINIVWNNEKTPEQMGILKNSSSWKRPINFYLSSHNSLDWRWKLAKGSKARVFFSIDDDIIISCEELTKGFRVWQANAIGEIGPIITFESRYFEYTKENGHRYLLYPGQFFNFGIVGFSFVSIHFMELYYGKIWQLQEMRKVVIEKSNCEDMALQWLAEYFYPELQTILIKGQVKNVEPTVGVSTGSGHAAKRNNCLNRFTHIFGATVLTQKPLTDKYADLRRWTFPFKNETILLKKKYLEREVINKDLSQRETKYSLNQQCQNNTEKIINLQSQLSDAILNQAKLLMKNQKLVEQVANYKQMLDSIRETKQQSQILAQPSIPDTEGEIKICEGWMLVCGFLGLTVIIMMILICRGRGKARLQTFDLSENSRMATTGQGDSDRRSVQ